MKIYRHGDLLLIKVSEKPKGEFKKSKDNVLLEGEASNHFHRLNSKTAVIEKTIPTKENDWNIGWFNLVETTPLSHEEHETIDLPAGIYKFFCQREYDPAEERRVID